MTSHTTTPQTRRPTRMHECPNCSRSFNRSDSLKRHIQLHGVNHTAPHSRRKSCQNCVKSKIRCSTELPQCSSCKKRQAKCVYAPKISGKQEDCPLNDTARASPTKVGNRSSSLGNNTSIPPVDESTLLQDDGVPSLSAFDFASAFPFNQAAEYSHEWLFDTTLLDGLQGLNGPIEPLLKADGNDPSQAQPWPGAPGTAQIEARSDRELDDDEAYLRSIFSIPDPHDESEPTNPWPMEWRADSSQLSSLPAVEIDPNISASRYFSIDPMGSSAWLRMKEIVQTTSYRGPWRAVSLDNFPSSTDFDTYIDLYFAKFNALVPMVHLGTFSTNQAHPVIILGIAAIGACFSMLDRSKALALALHELNRRILLFMSELDARHTRTIYYIASQLMQGLLGKLCGNQRAFELTESSRSQLVNSALCMGLFDTPKVVPPNPNDSLERRWQLWAQEETLVRLGWAVYLYDASVSFQMNKRPFASIASIQAPLPCSEQHWEAGNAFAWSALNPAKLNPTRPPFRHVLHGVFELGQGPAQNSRDWIHRNIIMCTLARMTWTYKEMASPFSQYFCTKGPMRMKADCLSAMENATEYMLSALSYKSLFQDKLERGRNLQIYHLTHLYAMYGLMDQLFQIFRFERDPSLIDLWIAADQSRARKAAFHSAQILGVMRLLPANNPMEPFTTFYAGTILWFISRHLRGSVPDALSQGKIRIHLDHLKCISKNPEELEGSLAGPTRQTSLWIDNTDLSESFVVGVHGVPNLAAPNGPQNVRNHVLTLLERIQVWGIAQNFSNVFTRLTETD